ncbi:MAG TPA: AtpZ/AtpI family protein [bacterium]|nr:AtpZ/AtpI family protein [bacterium]HPN67340.1 AtpZ/AtpI family protein [bacterium]
MVKKNSDHNEYKPALIALSIASQLGFTIALPLVVLALAGRYLDKIYHSSPLFLLIGLFVAFALSSYAVWQKTSSIYAELEKAAEDKPQSPTKK